MGRSKGSSTLEKRSRPARDRAASAARRARFRAAEASAVARERAAEAAEVARERAAEAAEVARERAAEAAEVARERAQELEPTLEQVRSGVGTATRRTVAAASNVPAILARILAIVASLLGSAAESGRALASEVDPPRSVRRRRRTAMLAWFAGGLAVGAAAGWIARDRMSATGGEEEEPELPIRPGGRNSSYPREVDAIDARRSSAPTG